MISLAFTRRALTAAATLSLAIGGTAVLATPANAACSDVDVVFARGSLESPGTGLAGGPFTRAVTSGLPGLSVSSYAVNYAADAAQTSAGAGSTDLVKHLTNVAASCSSTRFVLGGYSQGATVVDIALGIRVATGGAGTAIPATLADRVAAVVVFGNPLGVQGSTIAKSSPTYGARSKDYCATGDPVCGGGGNFAAHLSYGGAPATDGAAFAVGLVKAGTVPVTPTPTTPVPTTPVPTTPTTPVPTSPVTPVPTTPAPPAANPFQRGPDPTTASIEATTGPFAIAKQTVARGNGFGGGTIYYPTDTSVGTYGGVAISPGFISPESAVSWYGPRLASQGFVVFTIATNSTTDSPSSRGTQLLAALTYLTTSSPAASRVDPNRLAVMGHSMGGGGALEAANKNKALKAAIPLTGYDSTKSFPGITTPTLVIGAQSDTTAPPATYSIPFYQGLTGAPEKVYLELKGASHSAPTSPNVTIAKYSISWLKRFVDNDQRYSQFICPGPGTTSLISTYTNTCPV